MPQFMKNPNKCSGASCKGCASANCYSDGGPVDDIPEPNKKNAAEFQKGFEKPGWQTPQGGGWQNVKDQLGFAKGGRVSDVKGVHTQFGERKGQSYAGKEVRDEKNSPINIPLAKAKHEKVLSEMKSMKKPELYAHGGKVKGVHRPSFSHPGISESGEELREPRKDKEEKMSAIEDVKGDHANVLREMKAMKKPNLYAKGGEVATNTRLGNDIGYPGVDEDPNKPSKVKDQPYGYPEGYKGMDAEFAHGGAVEDGEDEMELHHAIGGELMDALERKDKKGIMSALEAAIMQCMGKD